MEFSCPSQAIPAADLSIINKSPRTPLRRSCPTSQRTRTRQKTKQAKFKYIEVLYNRQHQRRHSTIGYEMPLAVKKGTEKLRDSLSRKVLPYLFVSVELALEY